MMGKTASVVKMQVAATGDKKEVEGGSVAVQDLGRKLAMHIVSSICCYLRLIVKIINIYFKLFIYFYVFCYLIIIYVYSRMCS